MAATLTQGAINSLGLSPSTPESRMTATLTHGAIEKIFSGSVYSSDRLVVNPVLQIIELKKRCVWLSDGTNSVVGMLAGNLFNSDVYLKKLQKYSFAKLNMYTLSSSLNRVVFIFDCDILPVECDVIIGEPAPLPRHTPHLQQLKEAILLKYASPQVKLDQLLEDYNHCQPLFSHLGVSDLGFSDLDIQFSGLTLYDNDKPQGALEIMFNDKSSTFLSSNNLKPVLLLQVYMIDTCFCISLSDGKNIIFAMTPTNLEDELKYFEVDDDIPSSGFKDKLLPLPQLHISSIVLLNNYVLKEFCGLKFIIIFDFDVILENHVFIGFPVKLVPDPNLTHRLWSPISDFRFSCRELNLTQGAIETILCSKLSSDKGVKPLLQPLLQVLGLSKSNILLSDGLYAFNLIHNLREQRFDEHDCHFSVVKLTDYYVDVNSQNHRIVVILDLEVILFQMTLIGHPAQPPNKAPYQGVSLAIPSNMNAPIDIIGDMLLSSAHEWVS